MFTDQELKDLHYQMWDYIVDKIQEYKRVINITEAKLEFLQSQNIDDSILHNCPMCHYSSSKYKSYCDITPCKHCPSALNVNYIRGCLSGIYELCLYTDSCNCQLTLALAIRDSWMGGKVEQ